MREVGVLPPQRIIIYFLWFVLFSFHFHAIFLPLSYAFLSCVHWSTWFFVAQSLVGSALKQFRASEIFKPFYNSVVIWPPTPPPPPLSLYLFAILPTSLHGTCLIPLVPTLRCHSYPAPFTLPFFIFWLFLPWQPDNCWSSRS